MVYITLISTLARHSRRSQGQIKAPPPWSHLLAESPHGPGRRSWFTCLPLLTVNHGMYTVEELARTLGISVRQVRERIYALSEVDGLLSGQVRKGPKGRKEYSPGVLEMLKEMEQLHGNLGKSLRKAAEEIAGKIKHDGKDEPPEPSGKDVNLAVKVAELQAKVEGLERLLRAREDELAYLRDRVAFLEGQLALPKPEPAPRRPWWAWFIRRNSRPGITH